MLVIKLIEVCQPYSIKTITSSNLIAVQTQREFNSDKHTTDGGIEVSDAESSYTNLHRSFRVM